MEEKFTFLKKELFKVWRSQKCLSEKNTSVLDFIRNSLEDESKTLSEDSIKKINNFTSKLASKWAKHHRLVERFLTVESDWLDESIELSCHFSSQALDAPSTSTCIGRPPKPFEDLSVWSKRRVIKPLLEVASMEELTFAASCSLNLAGRKRAGELVRSISSPKLPCREESRPQPIPYTPEEALALFIDGRFSKYTYTLMQQGAKRRVANLYPTYKKVALAKKACYPRTIEITETSAKVSLQALADHTANRLISAIMENLSPDIVQGMKAGITLTIKWGCDGSSGHSAYKQKFDRDDESDEFLFIVCFVPLQIKAKDTEQVIWLNPRPSSTRFCRPIKIMFKKESQNLIKEEVKNIEEEIINLERTKVKIFGEEIIIDFEFHLTMIDGKTFGAVTETSNQSCAICGATPKIMNDLDIIEKRRKDFNNMKYGLSTLHCYIRCLECILHIAYRLEIGKWQIREDDKKKFQDRKIFIQNELKRQLGLLVDIPKPSFGTTNDGNTARRFFANYDRVSQITGVNEELVKRFGVILNTMSSGYKIDANKFQVYSYETAKLYINLYPWYYMPASVHRILIHGAEVIKAAVLPIGMLSEEALESRNKDVRRYRENNTRKNSRLGTMTDLFHTLMFSSDPLISSMSERNVRSASNRKSVFESDIKSLTLEEPDEDEEDDDLLDDIY